VLQAHLTLPHPFFEICDHLFAKRFDEPFGKAMNANNKKESAMLRFKRYLITLSVLAVQFPLLLSAANTTLTPNQTAAVLSVVTNYILSDENPILEITQPDQVVNVNLSNVKTIKCSALNAGDTFTINGELYTVVGNTTFNGMDPSSDDFMHICTSKIVNMNFKFSNAASFNQPIGKWDTSNVTSMVGLFQNATAFNQPIGNWNTSNVTNMNSMFKYTTGFNQPIGNWDTSNVTDMRYMFESATSFDQPIGNWDISSVTEISRMFYNATAFNQPIGNWDISNLSALTGIFQGASSFNQPIGNWDTSNIINMHFMFSGASSFTQNISGWCVDNIYNKPINFDTGAGFEGQTTLQPQWGTCP